VRRGVFGAAGPVRDGGPAAPVRRGRAAPSTSPLEGLFRRGAGLSPPRRFRIPVWKSPSLPRAVGSVASVAELHCLMNRSGITVTVAAADASVAPLRGREHCALAASLSLRFVRGRSYAPARGEAVPSELGGFVWRWRQSL